MKNIGKSICTVSIFLEYTKMAFKHILLLWNANGVIMGHVSDTAFLPGRKKHIIRSRGCFTKTYLFNFDPLKPHFYIVKMGFTGYTLFFLFLLKNIDCGYSLEPPRRSGSNGYPQSKFLAEI